MVGSIVLGRQEFSVFIGAQGSAVGVFAADGKILPANLHRAENFSLLCLRGCLQSVVQHIEKKAAQVILSDLQHFRQNRTYAEGDILFLRLCRETLKNRVDCRVGSKIPGRKLFQLPVQSV